MGYGEYTSGYSHIQGSKSAFPCPITMSQDLIYYYYYHIYLFIFFLPFMIPPPPMRFNFDACPVHSPFWFVHLMHQNLSVCITLSKFAWKSKYAVIIIYNVNLISYNCYQI